MFRVQFSITKDEYDMLMKKAIAKNLPTVSAYCKSKVLPNSSSIQKYKMSDIVNMAEANIKNMPDDSPFYLRDLFPNPPANLGTIINRKITQNEEMKNNEESTSICRYKKDRTGTWTYVKAGSKLLELL